MVRLRRMAPDVYDPTGLAPIGERTLRCIDPSHEEPCTKCNAPPANGEDSFWSLRGDPGKRNGDKKLRTLIQMTREWNSPLERAHLVHYLQNSPEFSHMGKVIEIVRRKETPRLSKMCMMVLARAWGFRSDIWTRKCFSQPFYQYPKNGSGQHTTNNEHAPNNHSGGEPQIHKKRQKLLHGTNTNNNNNNGSLNRSTSGDISGTETNLTLTTKKENPNPQNHSNALQGSPQDLEERRRDQRDQMERDTLARFTSHLQLAQASIAEVIDHTQAACSCCSAMNPQQVSHHEQNKKFCTGSVRSTAELISQIKPACEDCLNMLQQVQEQSSEMLEERAWKYINLINQMDKLQTDFEHIFWTGLLSCEPDTFATSCSSKFIKEVTNAVFKFHSTTLKLCSTAKGEVAMARNLTLGEYCTISLACVKVFYVVIMEAKEKMSNMIYMLDSSTAANQHMAAQHQHQQQLPSSPNHHHACYGTAASTSAALSAPVLSGSVPNIDQTNNLMMPDYSLKLLRSLSNEIVFPRSISNEILLPFGLLESLSQGGGSQPPPPPAAAAQHQQLQPIQKQH
jgi:hypothetical protein